MSNYSVDTYTDTYTLYELKEASTNSRVLVCPERGGIVIGCQLFGQELFYLDKATFDNPATNIRGGNPILFPICGSVEQGIYNWKGQAYSIGQHGVARSSAWEVIGTNASDNASITISLRSNEQTLQAYPFEFELQFTYELKDGKLHTRQSYRNLSSYEKMPFYAGFHPYFALEGSKVLPYETDATEFLDYNDFVVKPYDGVVDLESRVESVCFLNAKKREIAFPVSGGTRVRLSYDDAFKYVVLWSIKDRPFICVEPWMAMPGEMNRQEELILLEPGDSQNNVLTISIDR